MRGVSRKEKREKRAGGSIYLPNSTDEVSNCITRTGPSGAKWGEAEELSAEEKHPHAAFLRQACRELDRFSVVRLGGHSYAGVGHSYAGVGHPPSADCS